jgi:hypothetical protein
LRCYKPAIIVGLFAIIVGLFALSVGRFAIIVGLFYNKPRPPPRCFGSVSALFHGCFIGRGQGIGA